MATWTQDELDNIGAADELEITTIRRDGTARLPVPIWVIRVGDELYIRSYRGQAGIWFKDTQARPEGHIQAGGVDKDVSFTMEFDPAINDQIDAVYRSKYRHSAQYVPPMLTPEVRATTIKLVPLARTN